MMSATDPLNSENEGRQKVYDNLEDCAERSHLITLVTEDTIWDWDLKTDIVERSPQAAKYGHEDWYTNRTITWWEDHIHPDDRDATISALSWAIKSGKANFAVGYRFCKADGDFAYIYDRASIIRDDDGVAIRVIGAMVDVTELRLVKILLRKTESQLAFSTRLNAMGTMGSLIAHELSQPLAAAANYMRASLRLSKSGELANFDRLHEALKGAEENTLRAGEILRRLRELVTQDSANGSEHLLAQLIDDGCTIGLSDAPAKAICLQTNIEPGDLMVWVDQIQVQQVIINLVRNSVEAMVATHDPEIVVNAVQQGKFAEVSITDNGSGIADEIRNKIFSAITTTKAAGMGIGLSICRTIIEAQGGEIWLAASAPRHTEFKFTLPLRSPTQA